MPNGRTLDRPPAAGRDALAPMQEIRDLVSDRGKPDDQHDREEQHRDEVIDELVARPTTGHAR
jgi:hypothetical protein